jgi:hypothetical protein
MGLLSSTKRKSQRFVELTAQERWILLKAIVLLSAIAVGRRWLSFKQLRSILGRAKSLKPGAMNDDVSSLVEARRIARMVQIAADHGFFRPSCLERALALWALLQLDGIKSELRIGARKENDRFQAHAWVEFQGTVLDDANDVDRRYAVFTL